MPSIVWDRGHTIGWNAVGVVPARAKAIERFITKALEPLGPYWWAHVLVIEPKLQRITLHHEGLRLGVSVGDVLDSSKVAWECWVDRQHPNAHFDPGEPLVHLVNLCVTFDAKDRLEDPRPLSRTAREVLETVRDSDEYDLAGFARRFTTIPANPGAAAAAYIQSESALR